MAEPCPHDTVTCTTTLRTGTPDDGPMVGAPLLTVAGNCTACGGVLRWPHLATISPQAWQDVATSPDKHELRVTVVVETVEREGHDGPPQGESADTSDKDTPGGDEHSLDP